MGEEVRADRDGENGERSSTKEGDSLQFQASIAPTSTAIKFDGAGGGARVQLDLPESQYREALVLTSYRGMLLNVTVEVDENSP
jgi:hypothetical protein